MLFTKRTTEADWLFKQAILLHLKLCINSLIVSRRVGRCACMALNRTARSALTGIPIVFPLLMLLNSRSGKNAKQYVERKLRRRLHLFFIVFVILNCIIIYEISQEYIEGAACVGAMMMGMLYGAAFVRRKRIYWEEETSMVIARMDKIGISLLVIYILFAVARHFFLHNWLRGNQLTAFSLSLAAGAMLGRLLSMRSQIRQILKERKII